MLCKGKVSFSTVGLQFDWFRLKQGSKIAANFYITMILNPEPVKDGDHPSAGRVILSLYKTVIYLK